MKFCEKSRTACWNARKKHLLLKNMFADEFKKLFVLYTRKVHVNPHKPETLIFIHLSQAIKHNKLNHKTILGKQNNLVRGYCIFLKKYPIVNVKIFCDCLRFETSSCVGLYKATKLVLSPLYIEIHETTITTLFNSFLCN